MASAIPFRVIPCSEWGAVPPKGAIPYTGKPDKTIFHHTAGSNNYARSDSKAIVRSTQAYHMQGRGWCDIGYDFLVDKYGQIFEGRYGGAVATDQRDAERAGVEAQRVRADDR